MYNNLHCIICDLVYYGKEDLWMGKDLFLELELGDATSGVYHRCCIDDYLKTYARSFPDEDKIRIVRLLEDRLNEGC